MKRLILCALVALGGCSSLTTSVPNPVTPNRAYEIRLAYDAAEVLAINYIKRPLCPATLLCSEAAISTQLKVAGPKVRIALNNLTVYVKDHPNINAGAVFDAATTALSAFQAIEINNGIQ